jgi:serine/threonine protein kinase
VKISDFGLARLQESDAGDDLAATILTRPNMVMGTPDFLSPEQARCLHGTDIRSDLYSLGCTFHFLLTGEVPFYGGTAMEKLIRQNTEDPPPVEKFRSDVPLEVVAVLRKLMAKDPARRFQTPTELAAALEPFSVSGPTPWDPVRLLPDPDEELSFTPTGGTSPSGLRLAPSPSGLRSNTVAVQGDATPTPVEGAHKENSEEPAPGWNWLLWTAGLATTVAALGALALRWLR